LSAKRKALADLHEALANTLLSAIKNGVPGKDGDIIPAPAAILSVARQFLSDNKIEATDDNQTMKEMGSLVKSLPFTNVDEHGLPN